MARGTTLLDVPVTHPLEPITAGTVFPYGMQKIPSVSRSGVRGRGSPRRVAPNHGSLCGRDGSHSPSMRFKYALYYNRYSRACQAFLEKYFARAKNFPKRLDKCRLMWYNPSITKAFERKEVRRYMRFREVAVGASHAHSTAEYISRATHRTDSFAVGCVGCARCSAGVCSTP